MLVADGLLKSMIPSVGILTGNNALGVTKGPFTQLLVYEPPCCPASQSFACPLQHGAFSQELRSPWISK